MELRAVKLDIPKDGNVILGQTHFIKSAEDIYEALAESAPGIKFGLAFCESSGECLIRAEGNDEELKRAAADNALKLSAGHSFIVLIRNAYPINVLNRLKAVSEVCGIYCASANPVEVIVAETEQGAGILGVIDGQKPRGVEGKDGVQWRHGLLRKIGYKL